MSQVAYAIDNEENTSDEQNQFLTFHVGNEIFGVQITSVKEIIEYGMITTVPMMPGFVHGVLNLRGQVVPAIDLNMRFGRQPTEPSRRTCIIITEVVYNDQIQLVGIIVDGVNQVIEITAQDMSPVPTMGTKIDANFIKNMGRIEGRFVILLDLNRVMALDELSQISQLE